MTIDSATAAADAALPAQRGARHLRSVPPAPTADLPDVARWQVYLAVAAGLLGGVLIVAGLVVPW